MSLCARLIKQEQIRIRILRPRDALLLKWTVVYEYSSQTYFVDHSNDAYFERETFGSLKLNVISSFMYS